MTVLFAKLCFIVAVGKSVISSLKVLKNLSLKSHKQINADSMEDEDENSAPSDDVKQHFKAIDMLMFWSIFAFLMLWEIYVEYFIRWFPLYYYLKGFLVLFASFPSLKITHLLFKDALVPTIAYCNNKIKSIDVDIYLNIFYSLPLYILLFMFPMFHEIANNSEGVKVDDINQNSNEIHHNNSDDNNEVNNEADSKNNGINDDNSNYDSKLTDKLVENKDDKDILYSTPTKSVLETPNKRMDTSRRLSILHDTFLHSIKKTGTKSKSNLQSHIEDDQTSDSKEIFRTDNSHVDHNNDNVANNTTNKNPENKRIDNKDEIDNEDDVNIWLESIGKHSNLSESKINNDDFNNNNNNNNNKSRTKNNSITGQIRSIVRSKRVSKTDNNNDDKSINNENDDKKPNITRVAATKSLVSSVRSLVRSSNTNTSSKPVKGDSSTNNNNNNNNNNESKESDERKYSSPKKSISKQYSPPHATFDNNNNNNRRNLLKRGSILDLDLMTPPTNSTRRHDLMIQKISQSKNNNVIIDNKNDHKNDNKMMDAKEDSKSSLRSLRKYLS
eukprot:gene15469-20871_t